MCEDALVNTHIPLPPPQHLQLFVLPFPLPFSQQVRQFFFLPMPKVLLHLLPQPGNYTWTAPCSAWSSLRDIPKQMRPHQLCQVPNQQLQPQLMGENHPQQHLLGNVGEGSSPTEKLQHRASYLPKNQALLGGKLNLSTIQQVFDNWKIALAGKAVEEILSVCTERTNSSENKSKQDWLQRCCRTC